MNLKGIQVHNSVEGYVPCSSLHLVVVFVFNHKPCRGSQVWLRSLPEWFLNVISCVEKKNVERAFCRERIRISL
jgi:hypothetical protein